MLFKGYNLHNFIQEHAKDEKNYEFQSLIITLIFNIIVQVIVNILFAFQKVDRLLQMYALVCTFFWILFIYVVVESGKTKKYAYFYLIIYNFFYIPTYYFLMNTIFSGVFIFAALGIILTFYILMDKMVYVIAAMEVVWYVFLLVVSATHPDVVKKMNIAGNIVHSEILCFILCVSVPVIIVLHQTYFYDRENEMIFDNKELMNSIHINKSKFLCSLSNEIRTPVRIIMSMLELISRDDLDPVSKEISEQIGITSKQMIKVVNDMLEYANLDSTNLVLYPQRYNFRDLINNVIDSYASDFSSESSDFNVTIDSHIPMFLFGDNVRIRQVFMYLLFSLGNISKQDSTSLSIEGVRSSKSNFITLNCRITKSGFGLDKNDINLIMSAYTRYDSRVNTDFSNMALEFSICKLILEQMGGSFEIESIKGVGMAITFSFENYIISKRDMIGIYVSHEPTVLIYNDSKEQQSVWSSIFKGYNVTYRFVNGPNAFRKQIEEHKYSHIFITQNNYDILKEIIESHNCEDITYVIVKRTQVYSDFGGCKTMYYPITCLNVFDAINGNWKVDKYKLSLKNELIIYPDARILLVDDSTVNLRVLKGLLKTYKIEPDMASNSEESFELINKNFYDLIILDQFMPGVDGVELLHIIRSMANSNRKTPIVCATADFGAELGRRLKAEGFQDYLAKPVQQYHLERILRMYLPVELAEIQSKVPVEPKTVKEVEEPKLDPLVIDFEKGLSTLDGNGDAYNSVLNTYYKEGVGKIDEIKAEILSDDVSNYIINVHALKSSSASIGAEGLSKLFLKLEKAGREGETDIIKSETDGTLSIFEAVLFTVKEYLIKENAFEDGQAVVYDTAAEQINIEDIKKLQDAINKINLKTFEEILTDLSSVNYGEENNTRIKDIKMSFEVFDYYKVKELIQEMISALE